MQDFQTKFHQAYIFEDIPNPENEPYKSKYKARKIYEGLISEMKAKF